MQIGSMIIVSHLPKHEDQNVKGLIVYDVTETVVAAYMHDDVMQLYRPTVRLAMVHINEKTDMEGLKGVVQELVDTDPGIKQVPVTDIGKFGLAQAIARFRRVQNAR